MSKGSRGIGELLYIDQHILNEKKTRRKNEAMARTNYKKTYDMIATELDNKLPQNIQNITRNYKLYLENHENLESGIDSMREKFNWSEDPKKYIS